MIDRMHIADGRTANASSRHFGKAVEGLFVASVAANHREQPATPAAGCFFLGLAWQF